MRSTPHAVRNVRGSTYLALMFVMVIMAIAMTAAAKQWKTIVQREQEADLLWRGMEIQTAIQFYSKARQVGSLIPGDKYPLTLEELTKPPKPFLRRVYKDPMTGGDWQYIPSLTGGIMGVKSASTLTPLKQHQFPAAVAHFEGFDKYNQWVFQYPSVSTPATQGVPCQQNPGGTPGPPGQGGLQSVPCQQPLGSGPGQQGFPGQQPVGQPGQGQGFPGPPMPGFQPPPAPGGLAH